MFSLNKVRIHVEDLVFAHNLNFTFHRLLGIAARRVPLPKALFFNGVLGEQNLRQYMVPHHNGCFVDVGANVGMWTEPLVRKGVVVHAFEPSPKPRKTLHSLAESHPNLQVYSYALGDDCYNSKLNLHAHSGHNSLVQKAKDSTGCQLTVAVRTLDSFNLQNVGLIKIDTQAYELPVLHGAKETIARDKPRLVIEVHYPHRKQLREITRFLKDLGYRWFVEPVHRKPHFHVIGDPA